jgi:hypothetical protein
VICGDLDIFSEELEKFSDISLINQFTNSDFSGLSDRHENGGAFLRLKRFETVTLDDCSSS